MLWHFYDGGLQYALDDGLAIVILSICMVPIYPLKVYFNILTFVLKKPRVGEVGGGARCHCIIRGRMGSKRATLFAMG